MRICFPMKDKAKGIYCWEFPMHIHVGILAICRICIVGGGPSGLSAAYALWKIGYEDITVIEKHHTVGGMCETVQIEGHVYDLGGQVIARESAPHIKHLAEVARVEMEDIASHKIGFLDCTTGEYEDLKVANDYVSIMQLTLELQEKAASTGRNGVHAVSSLAPDNATEFVLSKGLINGIPKAVAAGYTASGYGFPEDMPYAYVHEFIRTSMFGKALRIKGGYTRLWEGVARLLPNVWCDTEVLRIERNDNIRVYTKNLHTGQEDVHEYDKIVLSGATPFNDNLMYKSSTKPPQQGKEIYRRTKEETELFRKVQTIDYYTTVVKISGFDGKFPSGFYYCKEYAEDSSTIGHPVAMQRFYPYTNVYLFWSYGNGVISQQKVADLVMHDVQCMGGCVEEIILQRKWKYFPHVKSKDMKEGFFDKLEALQGQCNTYYVGGLFAFELTERNSAYAIDLVAKHFAKPLQVRLQVKNLIEVPNGICESVKDLEEEEEFPELQNLDSYLTFYANHQKLRNKVLYTWLNEKGDAADRRTYAQLHENADIIAENILHGKHGFQHGDRVLLLYPPGLEFIEAFFGCVRANLIPVPLIPPDVRAGSSSNALAKVENVSNTCGPKAIFSTLAYHTAVRASAIRNTFTLNKFKDSTTKPTWPKLLWIHTDTLVTRRPRGILEKLKSEVATSPSSTCFLQFTSGSTGDPKGVMITHGALIHNVKLMRREYKSSSNTVLVSWLPQYHDMGLIGGLFTALVSGGTAFLFSPTSFVRNPLLWLEVMANYKATHSAGPNFAFELVAKKLELLCKNEQASPDNKSVSLPNKKQRYDLSSLRFLMVSAEPVRSATLKRFVTALEIKQEVLAPGYGLAENCVFVCVAWGQGRALTVDFEGRVCCGYVNNKSEDIDIRIVNPETHQEVEEGTEGEIWVRSPSNGAGYYGKERASYETFGVSLEGKPDFLRTGDLGRVIQGMLFVTGRIKDVMIIRGRNVYPSDIETTVERCSEAVRPGCCAAFAAPAVSLKARGLRLQAPDDVGVVIVAEVRDEARVDPDVVTSQIASTVASEHGLEVAAVNLIQPRTISKTSSGKIRRLDCLKQFTDGQLKNINSDIQKTKRILRLHKARSFSGIPTAKSIPQVCEEYTKKHEVRDFICRIVSERTGIELEKLNVQDSLSSYGLDSVSVVWAAQKLSGFLGVHIAAIDIYTAGSISELCQAVDELLRDKNPEKAPETATGEPEEDDNLLSDSELETGILPSSRRQATLTFLQFFSILYISAFLTIPAAVVLSMFKRIVEYSVVTSILCVPLVWLLHVVLLSLTSSLGTSLLLPSVHLRTTVPLWSVSFVRWWTCYRLQDFASQSAAWIFRGTVFLNWWYRLLGAQIGKEVYLDTTDITDPWLVAIADGAVVSEGATLQSHEVKAGTVQFGSVRLGRRSLCGPYSFVGKGSTLKTAAEISPLGKIDGGFQARVKIQKTQSTSCVLYSLGQLVGIYVVTMVSVLSGVWGYTVFQMLVRVHSLKNGYAVSALLATFPLYGTVVIPFVMYEPDVLWDILINGRLITLVFGIVAGYITYGLVLCTATCAVKWLVIGRLTPREVKSTSYLGFRLWFVHRLLEKTHKSFTFLLSGTELACIYLRSLGARIEENVSIRGINTILNPDLLEVGKSSHLGDFSKLITSTVTVDKKVKLGKIKVGEGCVVGAHSVLMMDSCMEDKAWLGAMSVAKQGLSLKQGGVYVGVENPTMVYRNTTPAHEQDRRILAMEPSYRKMVANLSAHIAKTSYSLSSRYFHRAGVGAKGNLTVLSDVNLPEHEIFSPGKVYQVVVRHSNSLSSDDDARPDARGASLRILCNNEPLLDLTMKTGKAFYARSMADFVTWFTKSSREREEMVRDAPHKADAVWDSLRLGNSYAEMHYYSNVARSLRSLKGEVYYVKFRLRPFDPTVGADEGSIPREGVLPPDTGALPRRQGEERSPTYLQEEFGNRVTSSEGVKYLFQMQFRTVPGTHEEREVALDCTRAWDEQEFPYVDVGVVHLTDVLDTETTESLRINPRNGVPSLDVVDAKSCTDSASIDHGRSVAYDIAQYVRNGIELPAAWKSLLGEAEVRFDVPEPSSGCPLSGRLPINIVASSAIGSDREKEEESSGLAIQPLTQVCGAVVVLLIAQIGALTVATVVLPRWYILVPVTYVASGAIASVFSAVLRSLLLGVTKVTETSALWGARSLRDTTWQAVNLVVSQYFLDLTRGSRFCGDYLRGLGASVSESCVYVDSLLMLNPDFVTVGMGSCVGRNALLFGHLYEGSRVEFGTNSVGEYGFVGTRSLLLPNSRLEDGADVRPLALVMKNEVIKGYH